MKQENSTVKSADGAGPEEVFRCMSCGAVIGYYEPGSAGITKCPNCKEDFRLDFKEECPTLKRIHRRAKGKATINTKPGHGRELEPSQERQELPMSPEVL